ncbi:MAG: DUF4301 family protein [Flavobacteriaceae bacterium]|nr:DUF4301 family protein [Bacteroidia bacterium]NNL16448.1 DUF4301 family protein [Flavobacteriaceae bacterium]
MSFSKKDKAQIENKGLTIDKVNAQIETFKKGLPFVNVRSAATVKNGIIKLSDREKEHFIDYYNTKRYKISTIKFVPASGAATRMFKFLFEFLEEYNPNKETLNAFINRKKATQLSIFLTGIEKFPFYKMIEKKLITENKNFDDLDSNVKIKLFVDYMLNTDKLNYSNFPKGLFPFHKYKKHLATAFEEHLFESALYASSNSRADLHFTISDVHSHKFDKEFKRIEKIVERKTNTEFEIEYSFQKPSTDTIAVTKRNVPFRDENGNLVFRPSGHGALLENLNELNADIIFVKNIDNVVVFKFEEEVAKYKMMLAGYLLEIQSKVFKYQEELEKSKLTQSQIKNISQFIDTELNVVLDQDFLNWSLESQIEYLKNKLFRPIRVCGMVKNEGEPGGGPFWVIKNDVVSLQIVESAQIDTDNIKQVEILNNSTHFNPVDLVLGVKNYKGEKYNLKEFVDPETGFITNKTIAGKGIKALELPGLWNGAMAYWNTIFIEVPLITFNPVKTVNDLLKVQHQIQ